MGCVPCGFVLGIPGVGPAWELLTHQTALTPRLQGISVVAAINVMVRNTTLSGTGVPWGTPPMSGTTIHV